MFPNFIVEYNIREHYSSSAKRKLILIKIQILIKENLNISRFMKLIHVKTIK